MLENSFRFPKSKRLLSPQDFKRVYANAKRLSNNNIALCATPNNSGFARIGFSFTKKRVKSAVNRNKLKRIGRECFRLHQHDLPAVDIIVMAKTNIDHVDNSAIMLQLENLWAKLKITFAKV